MGYFRSFGLWSVRLVVFVAFFKRAVHVMKAAAGGVDGACVSGTGAGHDGTEMFGQNGEGEQQQWRSLQPGSEVAQQPAGHSRTACYG